jgi:hypothetical protein
MYRSRFLWPIDMQFDKYQIKSQQYCLYMFFFLLVHCIRVSVWKIKNGTNNSNSNNNINNNNEKNKEWRYCSGYTYPEKEQYDSEIYTTEKRRTMREREKRIKKQTQTYQLFEKGVNKTWRKNYFTFSVGCWWAARSLRRLNRFESPIGPRVKLLLGFALIAWNVASRLC